MMDYVIVVIAGNGGVDAIYGPFDTEQQAREWAIGYADTDRFENWFSTQLSEPTDDDEGEEE